MKKIMALILSLAMVLSFASCGLTDVQKAEGVVNGAFSALKKLDWDEAAKYMDVNQTDKTEEEQQVEDYANLVAETLFGRLSHKIISSEQVDETTVNVTTEITTINMVPVVGDFIKEALQYAFSTALSSNPPSEEESVAAMEEMFVKAVSKEGLETTSMEVVLKVVNGEDGWKIDVDDTLTDAITGGLFGAFEDISNSFMGE